MRTTALYAGLLAPLFVLLSVRVIAARRRGQVALGDGGDALLARRVRVQANFAEYVPLGLILIGLSESLGAPIVLLHALGLALLAGRLSHAWGMSQPREVFAFRATGMALTFSMLLVGAGTCLVLTLRV